LDERIDHAIQARFTSDLRPLFADLPGTEPLAGRPAVQFRPGPPAYAPLLVLAPLLLIGLMVTAIVVGAPWVLWVFFWVFICGGFGGRRFHAHAHAHRQPPGYRR
jgi:hypothetical protein